MKLPLRSTPPLPLGERLAAIKQEIDDYIESRADAEYRRSEGSVPKPVIRAVLMNRSACLCEAYAKIREVEERDAEIAARQAI